MPSFASASHFASCLCVRHCRLQFGSSSQAVFFKMRVAGVLHIFQFETRQGEDICMALQTHINDIMMKRYSKVRDCVWPECLSPQLANLSKVLRSDAGTRKHQQRMRRRVIQRLVQMPLQWGMVTVVKRVHYMNQVSPDSLRGLPLMWTLGSLSAAQ